MKRYATIAAHTRDVSRLRSVIRCRVLAEQHRMEAMAQRHCELQLSHLGRARDCQCNAAPAAPHELNAKRVGSTCF